jgi:thiamine-monophosphate kinase
MLREYSELKKMLGSSLKSKKQVNDLFQSDCETLKLNSENYLTTSIDSIGEEITIGLYKDIDTWSWMTVMSSVSDLAASGSRPLGMTISTQWAFDTDEILKKKFFSGVNKACRKANVPLLGGDSGYAKDHVFTSSVLGHSTSAPLMRTGIRAGDYIVLAHQRKTGIGPALALRYLLNADESLLPENIFRPTPDWQTSYELRRYANASIDTSDGLVTGLYTLANLNHLGFQIHWSEKINHPQAIKFCTAVKYSPLMLWLGDHGDFQTVFVVPEKNLKHFENKNFAVLGQFQKKIEYSLSCKNLKIPLPIKQITSCARDTESYRHLIKDVSGYLARFI